MTDRLSATDLERHQKMLKHADEMAQLRNRLRDLEGALNVWGQDLCAEYGVNPAAGEGIEPDGTITRKDTE
jgi:hypothetical protein